LIDHQELNMSAHIEPFFDADSSTFSYVVHAGAGSACAIIDPVLTYDPRSGRTSKVRADEIAAYVRAQRLQVQWLLETHAHADHLSAAPYLRAQLGGRIAIGEQICQVQKVFKTVFNLEPEFLLDGSQFDHLFSADECFQIGDISAMALHVPGHTPADMAFLIDGDTLFVGDTLFMPDVGTARCDFPGGNAHQLYRSITRLLAYPPATALYVCHDYPPAGRSERWRSSVGEQRAHNIHVRDGISEDEFVAMRETRDRGLPMPVLMMPAVQVNIRAGELPPAEANGVRYLKIPLDNL
jgi:glyoxylase-like metal-dependent hydrolase (beta-lactamase superfamily II)